MMIEMKKIKLFIGIAAWLAVSTCCSTDPFADWGTETEAVSRYFRMVRIHRMGEVAPLTGRARYLILRLSLTIRI